MPTDPLPALWRVGSKVDRHVYGPPTEQWPEGEPVFTACTSQEAARIVGLLNLAERALKQSRLTRDQARTLMFFYSSFGYQLHGHNKPLDGFVARLRELGLEVKSDD